MPEMNDRDFLRNLDTDKYPGMCIIILSNLSDQEIIDDMLGLGAHEHFLKSDITPNSLIEQVDSALSTVGCER